MQVIMKSDNLEAAVWVGIHIYDYRPTLGDTKSPHKYQGCDWAIWIQFKHLIGSASYLIR